MHKKILVGLSGGIETSNDLPVVILEDGKALTFAESLGARSLNGELRFDMGFGLNSESGFSFIEKPYQQTHWYLEIVEQPTGYTGVVGTTHLLHCYAQGLPAPTYQWYKDNVIITGATSSNLTINISSPDNNGVYYCRVTNASEASPIDSNAVTVLAYYLPEILTAPSSGAYYFGQTVNLSATTSRATSHKWQFSEAGITYEDIEGATSTSYSFTFGASTDGYYRIVAINEYGYTNSSSALIRELMLPTYAKVLNYKAEAGLSIVNDKVVSWANSGLYSDFPLTSAVGREPVLAPEQAQNTYVPIYFNADAMQTEATHIATRNDFAYFALVKVTGSGGYGGIPSWRVNTGASTSTMFKVLPGNTYTSPAFKWHLKRITSSGSSDTSITSVDTVSDDWRIIILNVIGGTPHLYINGADVTSSVLLNWIISSTSAYATRLLILGEADTEQLSNTYVLELALWLRSLTSEEITEINAYASAKYGV